MEQKYKNFLKKVLPYQAIQAGKNIRDEFNKAKEEKEKKKQEEMQIKAELQAAEKMEAEKNKTNEGYLEAEIQKLNEINIRLKELADLQDKLKTINELDARLKRLETSLAQIDGLLRINIEPAKLPKAGGQLRIQQLASLSILKKLTRFFAQHEVHYWLDFGTLLGAVRHKGFIPWDDDIDISVPRADYEKLKTIIPEFCHDGFSYSEGDIIRIFYKRTSAQVDIFPYDSGNSVALPAGNKYRDFNNKVQQLYKSVPFNIITFRQSIIPEGYKKKIHDIYKKELLENKPVPDKAFMFLAYHCFAFKRVAYEYNDIFPLREIDFEDGVFSCPHLTDKFLHKYWGDYMSLPKNCNTHHPGMLNAMADYNNVSEMLALINSEKSK